MQPLLPATVAGAFLWLLEYECRSVLLTMAGLDQQDSQEHK